MEQLNTRAALSKWIAANPRRGLVPTMGNLHRGHLSLVERSLSEGYATLATLFVNPAQFDDPSDLAKYPRTLDEDLASLEAAGCQAAFVPSAEEVYPQKPTIQLGIPALENLMEGKHRPGHFQGMLLVVAKLLHLCQPHKAFFGQKDLQQFRLIERMVLDLDFPLELEMCPIVREADGLALSSRNSRLTQGERNTAPALYMALQEAALRVARGESIEVAEDDAFSQLEANGFLPDYVQAVDAHTLQPLAGSNEPLGHRSFAICGAARLGEVRLIDNVLIVNH